MYKSLFFKKRFLKYVIQFALMISLSLLEVGNVYAQLMPPPSLPPSTLPPIPEGGIHLPTTNIPSPPSYLSKNKKNDNQYLSSAQQDISDTFDDNHFLSMLSLEIKRLNAAEMPTFSVKLLKKDDPSYQQVIMMQRTNSRNEFAATRYEYGLTATMVTDGRMNGVDGSVCYIVIDTTQDKILWDKFIVPLQHISNPQSGAAWLMGHEVGHCMDQLERSNGLHSDMGLTIDLDKASSLGLFPDAVKKAYGSVFSKDAYNANPEKVYQYASQQQFGERVADAFATLWMMKLGANPETIDVLKNIRAQINHEQSHYTAPIFDLVKKNYNYASRFNRVDLLWDEARKIQQQAGVSSQSLSVTPQSDNGDEPEGGGEKVVKFIITSRGVVPVDAQGRELPQSKNTPAPLNFDNLKKFGDSNGN